MKTFRTIIFLIWLPVCVLAQIKDVPIFSWTKNHAAEAALAKANLARVAETNELTLIRQELRDALDELAGKWSATTPQ